MRITNQSGFCLYVWLQVENQEAWQRIANFKITGIYLFDCELKIESTSLLAYNGVVYGEACTWEWTLQNMHY